MSVNDHRTEPTTEIFEVMNGSTEYSATYIFGNEDHTLGNVLRYVLMQRKETDFCGYSIPHPYEPKLNIRLQTNKVKANNALKQGLKDLEVVASVIDDTYKAALEEFKSSGGGAHQ